MPAWTDVLRQLLAPLAYFVSPAEEVCLLYVALGVPLAAWVFAQAARGDGALRRRGFARFYLQADAYGHPSARLDLQVLVVNAVYGGLLLGPFLRLSPPLGDWVASALRAAAPAPAASPLPGPLVNLAFTVAAALAADFAFFVTHVLFHRVPFLWELHKVHHEAEVLTPLSAYRGHPLSLLITALVTMALVQTTEGLFRYFFPGELRLVTAFGVNAVIFVSYAAGSHLRHSHVPLSYGRALERLFISPRQHQVHHSADPRHFDKNFGGVFAVWDWLAGTLYVPAGDERLHFGLDPSAHRPSRSLRDVYLAPLARAFRPAGRAEGTTPERAAMAPALRADGRGQAPTT
ncbi:MAG TPA: sterol desaturase family protein [Polyangiaceae bacterium]|nr:sterol desaturase family protein [Polyangiaceae bacterium]